MLDNTLILNSSWINDAQTILPELPSTDDSNSEANYQTLSGRGGGIVFRILAVYSDDPSSNPAGY